MPPDSRWITAMPIHSRFRHFHLFHPPTTAQMAKIFITWPIPSLRPRISKDPSFGASWGSPGNAIFAVLSCSTKRRNPKLKFTGEVWTVRHVIFDQFPFFPQKKGRFIFTKRSLIQTKKNIKKKRNIFPPHPSSLLEVAIWSHHQGANPGIMCTWEVDAWREVSPRSDFEKSSVCFKKATATTGPFVWKLLSFTKLDHVGPFCWNRSHSDW